MNNKQIRLSISLILMFFIMCSPLVAFAEDEVWSEEEVVQYEEVLEPQMEQEAEEPENDQEYIFAENEDEYNEVEDTEVIISTGEEFDEGAPFVDDSLNENDREEYPEDELSDSIYVELSNDEDYDDKQADDLSISSDFIESAFVESAAEEAMSGTDVSGACGDNATWTLTGTDDMILTISGSGAMNDFSCPWVEDDNNRYTIKNVVVEEGITSIGATAFSDIYSLESVTLPSTIGSIGDSAFNGCSSLATVYYTGSASEWNAIDITNIGNDALLNAELCFITSDPATNDISPSIVLSADKVAYDGYAHHPGITVTDNGQVIDSQYYDVEYSGDCISAGVYDVIVTLKGIYSGTASASFEVIPREITPTIVLSESSVIYTGEKQIPEITVKDGEDELPNAEFDVDVKGDAVNVGTYTVSVQMKGNYTGHADAEYVILPKEIIPNIVLSKTSFVYNGKTQKPTVTVKDGDVILPHSEYNVTFTDGFPNARTYTITVKMKGNYSGTNTASYKITPKKITPKIVLSKNSFVYNGKTQKPTVTVKDGDAILPHSVYTVTFSSGFPNAGTYTITVNLKGNYSGTNKVTYKITPKKITPTVSLSKTAFAYNGKVQKPTVTIKNGSTTLTKASYTVAFSSGLKNPGIYTITVKLKGNYSGSKNATYRINPNWTNITSLVAGKNQMTVKWKKQAVQTTGYQLQYSVKSDFSKAVLVTIANPQTVSRTIKNLQKGSLYYVRVRAYKKNTNGNVYSAWSNVKTLRITAGTTVKFSKAPTIKLEAHESDFISILSWGAVSGATGYEISYKKGSNEWKVLKRVTNLKITNNVDHGVYYDYRVRAYQDRADGVRLYGPYSKNEGHIQSYKPSFSVFLSSQADSEAHAVVMFVSNDGPCSIKIHAKNARLVDRDYASYNRSLQLVQLNNDSITNISSVTIKPESTAYVYFTIDNAPTWYDKKSSVYYEFTYDGMPYYAFSSSYYGTNYYKNW